MRAAKEIQKDVLQETFRSFDERHREDREDTDPTHLRHAEGSHDARTRVNHDPTQSGQAAAREKTKEIVKGASTRGSCCDSRLIRSMVSKMMAVKLVTKKSFQGRLHECLVIQSKIRSFHAQKDVAWLGFRKLAKTYNRNRMLQEDNASKQREEGSNYEKVRMR